MPPVMNGSNIPIEVHETLNPVRIRYFGFISDTGGPADGAAVVTSARTSNY